MNENDVESARQHVALFAQCVLGVLPGLCASIAGGLCCLHGTPMLTVAPWTAPLGSATGPRGGGRGGCAGFMLGSASIEQFGSFLVPPIPEGGSPGFLQNMSSGGESGPEEGSDKKKRRSKPRGGRGHGGRKKMEKNAEASEKMEKNADSSAFFPQHRSRVPNAGPGILPDPEPATALTRPVIELSLPKHLAQKAAAQKAANASAAVPLGAGASGAGGKAPAAPLGAGASGAGGKAPRRPALATELRVDSFNPYARKTPSSTPNALTPATQLTLRWARAVNTKLKP